VEIGLGIVQRNNTFLFQERIQTVENLVWSFPGGKREPYDKTIEDTVVREVMEETGILCVPVRSLGVRDAGIIIHYILCDYVNGIIKPEKDKVKICSWFTPAQIYNLATTEIFQPVRSYFSSL